MHHEHLKHLEYEERIVNVDRGSFCMLVFSTSGAVGRLCDRFLKRLARIISDLDRETIPVQGHGLHLVQDFICTSADCVDVHQRLPLQPPFARL